MWKVICKEKSGLSKWGNWEGNTQCVTRSQRVVQIRLNVRERVVEQGDFQYLHYVIFKQLIYKYSGYFWHILLFNHCKKGIKIIFQGPGAFSVMLAEFYGDSQRMWPRLDPLAGLMPSIRGSSSSPWNALSAGLPCARSSLKDTQPRESKILLRTSGWYVQLNLVKASITC